MNCRNSKTFQLTVIITIFFLLPSLSQSFVQAETKSDLKPILKIDSDKQFDFAEFYFSNKEYLRAIGEYKRFIYFFPKDKRVESAMYRIGMAYYYDKRFREAIDSFKKLIDKDIDTDFSIKSYFMTSESYLRINAFNSAIINLHNLITITDDVNLKDKAYYRIGWIYIEMASWEKARVYFEKISAQNKQKYRFEKLSTELEKVKYIPEKNPQIAGFLSVIPGAGYLYCKRYKDAIIAFLLNTGLIYAAYESFDDDQYALGGLITFVGFGFYAGSIYGSITSAHKYNRKRTEKFIKNLRDNTKVNISADLKNKSVYLSLQFSF